MFKKILLGYAGDGADRDAAVLAAQLAGLDQGELEVVYPYHPLFAQAPCDVVEERLREELRRLLGNSPAVAEARYRWSGSSWPIHALHELAVHERSELLVIGAAPARLHRRHLNLMERMVHGAPCPVAVAPTGYCECGERQPRTIGVGFADSEDGHAAIALARELGERSQATVQVIAGTGLSAGLASYAAAAPGLAAAEDELYEQTRDRAQEIATELLGSCKVELDVRRGDPARLLIEASKTLDLLVLGSRAYGPVCHVLLGSVSAPVMRSARCPLLVVPRGVMSEQAPSSAGLQAARA